MDELDPHDDTSADYEQLETELLAQDQDAARAKTVDIADEAANNMVSDLLDAGVVTPVPEARVLVHEPSGTAFDSTIQLAMFHQGWTAAREADAQGE
ncbi:hypothetical protein HWV07_15520 [Natronomonas salina]|uniref:hypothetical protein n=1 Tax=Natronomonas salina TaxID=1710540 RepID=UPI0015B76BE3|nr:hypothetical protein [Natronomonas salina]QLD90368.1 hypothetical protein HWV07_15520 [Natronomonas salina]